MLTSSEAHLFWEVYTDYLRKHRELRRGQAMMNALAKVRPELYEEVSDTEADCFYIDTRITDFKRKVGLT